MNNDEIERRIALKKLFQERMNTVTEDSDTPYVSRLVKSEIKSAEETSKTPYVNRLVKNKITQKELNKIQKECFKPIVQTNDKNLNYSGSKYFGNTWLSNDEQWPKNSQGNYLIFILQLDIATLPEKYKKELGETGLFQLFFDYEYDGETLMRIVHPDNSGSYQVQPLNNNKQNNYYINNKTPKQKIIESWKSFKDLPHYEEDLDDDLMDLCEEIRENDEDDKVCAIQGDKLGGYAFWTQEGNSSDGLIYQLDAGCFYDGKHFKAHAPNLFASDGTAHIFYDKETKSFYFDWACG